jgi:hypothetical protein
MKQIARVFMFTLFMVILAMGPVYALPAQLSVNLVDGGNVVSSANPLHTSAACTVTATNQSGMAASGAAVTGNPVLIGGSDGTDARSIVTNASGNLVTTLPTTSDPCQNPTIAKSSAVINIGAAATTKVVDTSASTVVYVCGFTASLAGTTPTVVFKTGTHGSADCDTSSASLTGIFAPSTGSVIALSGAGTLMKSIAGGQICATTVGSGSSFQGVLNFVQQ